MWRYPIKSFLGEPLKGVRFGERGLLGDRRYALRDCSSGKVGSAKHPKLWGSVVNCQVRYRREPASATDAAPIRITLPDGRAVDSESDDVNAALSDLLGRPVELISQAPEGAEIEREWPDLDVMPIRGEITSGGFAAGAPAGTFFDYAPVHLLTSASLAALRAAHGGDASPLRFRPNLVIDTGDGAPGFVENAWAGATLHIGESVRLRVLTPSPRCIVPTLARAGLPADLGLLRALGEHNRIPLAALGGKVMPSLGVYAAVECGGDVRLGDEIHIETGG